MGFNSVFKGLRVTLLGTYVFIKTITLHRHENKYTLVVNILSTVH
jgi:hypothetical protein